MAELSSHSYHYNRNLLVSLPPFEPQMDLFDTLLPDNMSSLPQLSPSLEDKQEELELDDFADSSGGKGKGGNSKKKPRRKRRNLTGVSKQRRAANERERKRLQIINMAFKDLKSALPLFSNENNISKIEIVRLASRTIKYLSELVNNDLENDTMSHMDSRSPGGSVTSDHSESGSSISNPSPRPNFGEEAKLLAPEDIDISNLLSNYEELSSMAVDTSILEPVTMVDLNALKPESVKKQDSRTPYRGASSTTTRQHKSGSMGSTASSNFASSSSSSSSPSTSSSSSTSDGFSGFDINIFLDDSTSNSDDSKDDVFPSMLSFW